MPLKVGGGKERSYFYCRKTHRFIKTLAGHVEHILRGEDTWTQVQRFIESELRRRWILIGHN